MKQDKIRLQLLVLFCLTVVCMLFYIFFGLNLAKWKFVKFSLGIRLPKLAAMLLAAYAIGSASLVFQTIIGNRIVTPCLLGMNALYTTTHTALVFVMGVDSLLVRSANASFFVDLVVMSLVSLLIYGYMFQKTRHNVLYILLIGTVLASFFSSIQSTLVRVMDPTDYEVLLTSLVASFDQINLGLIVTAVVLLLAVAVILRRAIVTLDILALGKNQAMNLGIDYDRAVLRLLLGVTFYIAVATALVGPISFLGLIIANLAREFLTTYRHSRLIIASVLFGMIILIAGQMIVERIVTYSVPVSVFISFFGGVYFLYLILRKKKM